MTTHHIPWLDRRLYPHWTWALCGARIERRIEPALHSDQPTCPQCLALLREEASDASRSSNLNVTSGEGDV